MPSDWVKGDVSSRIERPKKSWKKTCKISCENWRRIYKTSAIDGNWYSSTGPRFPPVARWSGEEKLFHKQAPRGNIPWIPVFGRLLQKNCESGRREQGFSDFCHQECRQLFHGTCPELCLSPKPCRIRPSWAGSGRRKRKKSQCHFVYWWSYSPNSATGRGWRCVLLWKKWKAPWQSERSSCLRSLRRHSSCVKRNSWLRSWRERCNLVSRFSPLLGQFTRALLRNWRRGVYWSSWKDSLSVSRTESGGSSPAV